VEQVETPPKEAFDLSESIRLSENVFNDDGTVSIHVMRPCIGKGKGRHVYTAEMLKENAHKFSGWRMFKNHLSEQARRALGGLPRPIEHIGGRVIEAEWDETVPADPDRGFEQGAIVARVRPVGEIKALIEQDPELIEASINAKATSVQPVMADGKRAWLVEGIQDDGSVDWVTEAGAGGRVASLVESVYHTQEDIEMALLESMSDEELVQTLRENRPGLVDSLVEGREAPEGDTPPESTPPEGAETPAAQPAAVLREALESEEGQALITQVISPMIQEAVEFERGLVQAEASAEADRKLQLRDMRDEAHGLIEAARLPSEWEVELKGKYQLGDSGKPSDALDVLDEISDEGEVTKAAPDALREAVVADITRQRELIASARPTRVRQQGPTRIEEAPSKTEDETEKPEKPKKDAALWEQTLQEAGIDPAEAYE
jgi:hypothetical protein